MIHPGVSCHAVATCCEISGINIDPTGRSSVTKCSYRREGEMKEKENRGNTKQVMMIWWDSEKGK